MQQKTVVFDAHSRPGGKGAANDVRTAETQRERTVSSGVERHVAIESGAQRLMDAGHERPEPDRMPARRRVQLLEDSSVGLDDTVLEGEDVHPPRAVETGGHLTEPGVRRESAGTGAKRRMGRP